MTPSSRPGSPTSPCRRASTLVLPALLLVASATPARAAVRFEVSGAVEAGAESLAVRVEVRNAGDQPAPSLGVAGELLGHRDEVRIAHAVAPGQTVDVTLHFPAEVPRPGVHALILRLEHPEGPAPDSTSNLPTRSEPAYLLLALGQNAPPAVRVTASSAEIDVLGSLPVTLESADGGPHRVRLRATVERGFHADGPLPEVEVPGAGAVRSAIALRRAGAARGTRADVLVVAEAVDGPVARTSVTAAEVSVMGEPGLLPRLRPALFVLGGLLVAVPVLLEIRRGPKAPA